MRPFNSPIRIYCERVNDSLLGEPFNVISSLSFLLCAWLLWRLYKHAAQGTRMPEIPILITFTVCIGVGSTLFHTLASWGSILFDVVPIFFFVLFYLYVFARKLLNLSPLMAGGLIVLLAAVNLLYKYHVFRAMDGYVSYIPTFVFLLALAALLLIRRHPSGPMVLLATLIAFLSLFFRTVDRSWCTFWPLGTHGLWHLLNAVVVYILVRELIVHPLRPKPIANSRQ